MFERRLGLPLLPFTVRLNNGDAAALLADWPVINVSPDKHRGYAVQWFAMAFALAVFFLLRSSNLWALLARKPRGESEL